MACPRHLAWPGEVPAADQPDSRDGMRRGATRAGRDQRRAGAGEAGDADMMRASTPERFIIPSRLAPASPKEPAGSEQLSTGHRFFVKLFSEGLRLITISRARGHQRAGTTAEGRSVTQARSRWRGLAPRGDLGAAIPPCYGNRRTVVDRAKGSGAAAYSTSPKRAVMYPRRVGRRCT
jgi:hypothetical protein